MMFLRVAVTLVALGAPAPALAGPLVLVFDNGRVTVHATDVPLRQILSEWSRQGQTRVVGLERLGGAPVTLELTDVPEKQALEILLRSVAGYVAAPRMSAATPTISTFDRLVLLPTSVAAAAPLGGPRPSAFAPPTPVQQAFPDPIQLANGEPDAADPSSVGPPIVGPNSEPTPGSQMRPGALRPPQSPSDPTLAPVAEPPAPPQGPITTSRPGIIPAPQPQQPRP
jgi:hypothetical protein